jgi:hypothetical protein
MTKTYFWIFTAIIISGMIADVWQVVVVGRQYLIGGIILLATLGLWYVVWRAGREGAGWNG